MQSSIRNKAWYDVNKFKQSLIKMTPGCEELLTKFIYETAKEYLELEEIRIEKEFRPVNIIIDEKAVVNLTNIEIPKDVLVGLSFGPRFCFPSIFDTPDTLSYLAETYTTLENTLPIETHFETFKQLSIALTLHRKNFQNIDDMWLHFLKYRINKFTKNNPNVLITRSDKGKHTVIIEKSIYQQKVNALVQNTNDYIEIKDINVISLENKNNTFVDKLASLHSINNPEHFKEHCTNFARIYGLIKIHKKDFPARPIISACGSPGFKLAKFFTKILDETFPETGYHIKNSLEFKEKIDNLPLDTNDSIISFDVVSMFTNIPIDHMLSLIERRREFILNNYNIPFSWFERIMIFLLRECAVFSFENKIYKQKDSLAMGSPLSPILAKILMTDIISYTLNKLQIQPTLLGLYVDDSLWIINKNSVEKAHNILNSYHPRIKFTLETENGKGINFLDMTISRHNNNAVTNWYRKPFASSRLLNYFSYHSKTCIRETTRSFVRSVLNLSNEIFFITNKEMLEKILRFNNVPETDIITILHNDYTLMKKYEPKSRDLCKTYIPIKFTGRMSKFLKQNLATFTPSRFIEVPFRINSKHFSQLKSKIDPKNKTNLVSVFKCACDKYMIIRHTNYKENAKQYIEDLLTRYNTSKGRCLIEHKFNKISHIQCNNYTSMTKLHTLLTFSNRNKLFDTKIAQPPYGTKKKLLTSSCIHTYIQKILDDFPPKDIK